MVTMGEVRGESDSDTSVTEQLDKIQLDDVIPVDSNKSRKVMEEHSGRIEISSKQCQIEKCCCQNLTMIVYFLVSWWMGPESQPIRSSFYRTDWDD